MLERMALTIESYLSHMNQKRTIPHTVAFTDTDLKMIGSLI